ncbi:MAG: hypothetical protein I8H71_04475 [Xanthomonadaceae bacterium]|nr:hypothetical protein [Xanthomonadaceae bacterium]
MTNATALFLQNDNRSKWITIGALSVYIRKSLRYYDGKVYKCLDIANVEVEAHNRQQGHFRAWFAEAEAEAKSFGLDAIFIESVMSPVMADFCLRHGFTVRDDGLAPSYIKKLA